MPRSGSTLMCDLLRQTGVAGAPNSFFRWQSMADFANEWGIPAQRLESFDEAYLETAIRQGTADTGRFGMRIMWNNLPPLCGRLRDLLALSGSDNDVLQQAFGPLQFIHLSRADKVAEAVSLTIAHQTGLWHLGANGAELERLKPHEDPVYDAQMIMKEYREVTAGDRLWRNWFAAQGIAPCFVSYEALAANPQRELAKVLSFLGLAPGIAETITPGTQKLATDMSHEWVARFRAETGIASPNSTA